MNPLVLTCLLCFVVYRTVGGQKPEATYSSELTGVTGGPASGEGLLTSVTDDDELSGADSQTFRPHELHPSRDEQKRRNGKGKKKNKHKSKGTTPLNPGHTSSTSAHTSTSSTTEDPCTSTHLGYCIHGYCKHMEGLHEPVCICMKGYDGERCGIQTLGSGKTRPEQSSGAELVQTVLVIIAVVLSVISCAAILLMTFAHYRSHKNFLASYLGAEQEQEKLQKPIRDVMV